MAKRKYLVNHVTGKKYRLNGIQLEEELAGADDSESLLSNSHSTKPSGLPPGVDLRAYMTAVENQSQTACCVANALAGACEYLLKKESGQNIDLSRFFIYYNARKKSCKYMDPMKDSGCTVTNAVETLKDLGVCLESLWTYDLAKINEKPSVEAYEAAKKYRISNAFKLTVDLLDMKSCLASGFPFVFGLRMYKSFDRARKSGLVPMPQDVNQKRSSHGTHSMLAVGYNDFKNFFIVRNSWGEKWGDKGYCYIPYDYMADERYTFAPWAVLFNETKDMGRDHWIEQDPCPNVNGEEDSGSDDDDNRSIEDLDDDDDDGYSGNLSEEEEYE